MKRLKRYSDFYENGCATGYGSGSGDVSNPVVGALPGVPGKAGSGDVSRYLTSGGKKRKKGSPSEVSDLRDLEDADTNKDPYSADITESIDEGGEEYQDIKWALIDFIDEGFDLRIKKYDDPEEIQEMTIAMYKSVDMRLPIVNMIKGSFDSGSFRVSNKDLDGRNKDWVEGLEQACHIILNLMGYDHGSFEISQIKAGLGDPNPISRKVSVNIHIHMMKDPEK